MKWRFREKISFGMIGGGAYFSGVLLFLFSHWIRVSTQVGEQHSSFERWLRPGHSFLTYLVIFSSGYIFKIHVLPGLKGSRRKLSGIFVFSFIGILWLSALGVLYLGESDLSSVVAWTHGLFGCAVLLFLFLHLRSSLRRPLPPQ